MLSHAYNIIIDCCDGAPGHGREVVNGLNATDKRFISMLMTNFQLHGEVMHDKIWKYILQMLIKTSVLHGHFKTPLGPIT